jgi:hypothetical protein
MARPRAAKAHLGRMKMFQQQLHRAWSNSQGHFGNMPIKLDLHVKEAEYWAEKEGY